jgi:hypothetical protein
LSQKGIKSVSSGFLSNAIVYESLQAISYFLVAKYQRMRRYLIATGMVR